MKRYNLLIKAMKFAQAAHQHQKRDDGQPYIVHPRQVAEIMSMATDDPEILAAAWLHDVVEDTPFTEQDLRGIFGDRITDLVMEVTHETTDWGEHYFPRLHSLDGVRLKLADRMSNLSSMAKADGWTSQRQAAYIRKSIFVPTTKPKRGHK